MLNDFLKVNKSFVKKYDNIESAFKQVAKEQGIKDYDKKMLKQQKINHKYKNQTFSNRAKVLVEIDRTNCVFNIFLIIFFVCF